MKEKFKVKTYVGSFRSWMIALFDLFCVACCFYLSLLFGNFDDFTNPQIYIDGSKALPIFLLIFFAVFFIFKIFKTMWRYAGVRDYARLAIACVLSVGIFMILDWFVMKWMINRPAVIAFLFTSVTIVCSFSRITYAWVFSRVKRSMKQDKAKRVMVIGAGYTAKTILEELLRDQSPYKPVCVIDDDVEKIGRTIYGVQVVGNTNEIPKYAKRYGIDTIVFAIPSINPNARKVMLANCLATDCEVKVLPYVSEMVKNVDVLSQTQEIKIEDLLGRAPIEFNDLRISKYIKDKVCLVTGGGGSIGSELCRQIARFGPKKLIILDIYENSSYDIQQELIREHGDKLNLSVEIASVTDYDKMYMFFEEYQPEIIFHAAAHKHVPLMETNPEEAVKNNVFGTYNMASLAALFGAKKFIMISTDKAVNPTNIMGATKRCCEMIVQSMAQKGGETEFASVRFGNVLGSNGSVIPLFKKQILNGGPVTVTHKEMIRYFMLIPEAVSLVLQAGAFANGGEIFVLDMGSPVKILTLAENLIRMMGKKPYEEIQIEFTGLRPGEKLYEELLMSEEGLEHTENKKIFIGRQIEIKPEKLEKQLSDLRMIVGTNDKEKVVSKIAEIVPTYNSPRIKREAKTVRMKKAPVPKAPAQKAAKIASFKAKGK